MEAIARFQTALAAYGAGDLAGAEAACQEALALDAGQVDSLNMLAVLRFQAGAKDEAVGLMRQVTAAQPNNDEAHFNLAKMLGGVGDLDGAAESYRVALALKPDDLQSLNNLGAVLGHQGKLEDAAETYRMALAIDPDQPKIQYNMGDTLLQLGHRAEAAARFETVLRLDPDHGHAHNGLAALSIARGDYDQAIVELKRAIKADPTQLEARANLADALRELGRLHEAVTVARKALDLDGDYAPAYVSLGLALRLQGKLKVAADCFRAAVAKKPDFAPAMGNLGDVLMMMGQFEEGIPYYRRSLEINPKNPAVFSNYLFSLNYVDGNTRETVFAEHRRYETELAGPEARHATPHRNDPDPDRPLRIGYVSADYRVHSVAYFFEPLLARHDRDRYWIALYYTNSQGDAVTERLRAAANAFVSCYTLDNDAMTDQVRADGIDILVDLTSHTGNNRLRVFARKPAPVQVAWLGYPNTTGVDAIGYRLTDAICDPEDADAFHSETLLRLEGGFHCYRPPADAPEVAPAPALQPGKVTFGCFNNPTMLNPFVIALWARLLQAAPDAALLLKGMGLEDPDSRAHLLRQFAANGVGPDRLELVGQVQSTAEHLALYARVDIGLDPFPYNGTTTTFEALLMGVPVVTLRGDRHAARVGADLLHRVGRDDLVAPDEAAYLDTALALARDLDRLRALRGSLRGALLSSPLCDEPGFAAKLEATYRRIWREWCARAAPCANP